MSSGPTPPERLTRAFSLVLVSIVLNRPNGFNELRQMRPADLARLRSRCSRSGDEAIDRPRDM